MILLKSSNVLCVFIRGWLVCCWNTRCWSTFIGKIVRGTSVYTVLIWKALRHFQSVLWVVLIPVFDTVSCFYNLSADHVLRSMVSFNGDTLLFERLTLPSFSLIPFHYFILQAICTLKWCFNQVLMCSPIRFVLMLKFVAIWVFVTNIVVGHVDLGNVWLASLRCDTLSSDTLH